MKFLVDELPYYGDDCPFKAFCINHTNRDNCPRYWDKYKICSTSNPHECEHLKEGENKK